MGAEAPGHLHLSEPNARWRLTWSCGWHTEISQQWAAEGAAKLHSKLRAGRR